MSVILINWSQILHSCILIRISWHVGQIELLRLVAKLLMIEYKLIISWLIARS